MKYRLTFKDLFLSDRLFLFILISLYLMLELINIKLPGLYCDEAFSACGTLQIIKGIRSFMPSFRIFNINFPIMLGGWAYETALESYILLPFLWLFGINTVTLRLIPVVIGAITLIFTYLFLKDFFNRKVGILTLCLLIINPIFLLETKLGLNSASMLHFAGIMALYNLFRWYKNSGNKYFYLGIFFLSLGISIRVWFLWYVNSLFLLAIIFNRELRKIMKSMISKYIIMSFLILLLGNSLFVFYNIVMSKFGNIRYILEHFSRTHCSINNLDYFHNLSTRFHGFIYWLNGKHSLMEQGSWHNWTPVEKISANNLYPYLFLGAIIWLFISILLNKTSFSKKKVSFILILFLLIFLQTPFTLSTLGGPHLFILYPLVQIILGLALIHIIKIFKKNKVVLTIIISTISIFIFLECYTTLHNNYLYFYKTGGTGNYSDSIYALSKHLKDNRIYKPVMMDWGIYHSLIFISQGKLIPQTFNYIEGGHEKEEFMESVKSSFREPNLYVFHASEFVNRPEIYSIFNKMAKDSARVIVEEKIFYQKDGRPVYVLYSLR